MSIFISECIREVAPRLGLKSSVISKKTVRKWKEYQGINRTPISFLMVDLDLKDFGVQQEEGEDSKNKKGKVLLEKALNKALDKIKKESIGGNPTVL